MVLVQKLATGYCLAGAAESAPGRRCRLIPEDEWEPIGAYKHGLRETCPTRDGHGVVGKVEDLDQQFIVRAAEITVNDRGRVWHHQTQTRWGAAAEGH